MSYDLANRLAVANALVPAVLSSNTNGVVVDTAGSDGVNFTIQVGDGTVTGLAVAVAESVNSNFANSTAVAADFITTATPNIAVANSVSKLGIKPNKRYVRLAFTANSANVAVSASAQLRQTESP